MKEVSKAESDKEPVETVTRSKAKEEDNSPLVVSAKKDTTSQTAQKPLLDVQPSAPVREKTQQQQPEPHEQPIGPSKINQTTAPQVQPAHGGHNAHNIHATQQAQTTQETYYLLILN